MIGGGIKLLGDFVGLVPPLGISVVIDYVSSINEPAQTVSIIIYFMFHRTVV